MATSACTNIEYKHFNGWWSTWSSSLSGGYCGNKTYMTILKFKTPNPTTYFNSNSLSITIPYVRQSWSTSTSGTVYVKLTESSPACDYMSTTIGQIPSASYYTARATYEAHDLDVHTVTLNITDSTLKKNTVYYLAIGCSVNFLEIGYSSSYDYLFKINLAYKDYDGGGPPENCEIVDTGNNAFKIVGNCGDDGTNNKAKSVSLYFTVDGSAPNAANCGKSDYDGGHTHHKNIKVSAGQYFEHTFSIPTSTLQNRINKTVWDPTRTDKTLLDANGGIVKLHAYTNFEKGLGSGLGVTKRIKYHLAPTTPSDKPTLISPKLGSAPGETQRFTMKQPWTFELPNYTNCAGNECSPVDGFRVRLRRTRGTQVTYLDIVSGTEVNADGTPKSLSTKDIHGYYYDRDFNKVANKRQIIFNPKLYDLKPGDKIEVGVLLYHKKGTGDKLFNNSGVDNYTWSDKYTIENAGVVHVYVDNNWQEGQVYVKWSPTGRAADVGWYEAEIVASKAADNVWYEST